MMICRTKSFILLGVVCPWAMACTLDVYSEPGANTQGETPSEASFRPDAGTNGQQTCDAEDCERPSCTDGVKNQGEEKVDCGGPCEACGTTATCSDKKRNQDEEGVDCGGVCQPCAEAPSCSDGERNQDEEGVDCGGGCDPCPPEPSCDDAIQNQDEEEIDCGGTCAPCAVTETCSDGVLNQDEDGVDCGGTCDAACPTCDDGVQNQDEVGIDCGGSCDACPPSGNALFVGNITQGGRLLDDFGIWNQLTPENEGKWRYLEPVRDQMQWGRMDAYYQYTRERGIAFKAHTFCWGSQAPEWIDDLSEPEQAAEVEEYIQSFCERYPDVEMIDVVNEPDHAPPTFRDALGGAGATGHDWVIQCFEWARQYCPDAILILNDYNTLRWDTDEFIAIAEKVKATGLLDAVGEQGHGLETISFTELQFNFGKLAALDVPIYISEYDVDLANDEAQLAVFKQQFPFFYNQPQVVGITLWGYAEGLTWLDNTHLMRYDGSYRPAFDWLSYHYLSAERVCGNATCEEGEECSTCSKDCGACL